jgi:hypothetical protein
MEFSIPNFDRGPGITLMFNLINQSVDLRGKDVMAVIPQGTDDPAGKQVPGKLVALDDDLFRINTKDHNWQDIHNSLRDLQHTIPDIKGFGPFGDDRFQVTVYLLQFCLPALELSSQLPVFPLDFPVLEGRCDGGKEIVIVPR